MAGCDEASICDGTRHAVNLLPLCCDRDNSSVCVPRIGQGVGWFVQQHMTYGTFDDEMTIFHVLLTEGWRRS